LTVGRERWLAVAWWLAALAIAALALALRVHALGVPNLTNDEWFMLRNHDQGPLWIIHQAHTFEPHPLLYYLGLAGWIELAGRTEFALRFPSAASGVVLTVGAMGLGRAVVGQRTGLIAGALVALNPYQIAESQNARNYAPVVALSALASLLFLRALRDQRPRDWIAYGVVMLLALNTHLDAALVLMVHVAYVGVGVGGRRLKVRDALKRRMGAHRLNGAALLSHPQPRSPDRWKPWLITTAVVSVCFGLWLLYAWPALVAYHGYFPEAVSLERVVGRSLATFSLGAAVPIRQALPAFALAAIGLVWLVGRQPMTALFLGLYTALPILAVSLLFLVRPMFDERYLIVLAPGYLIVVAAGLEGLLRAALPIGILAAAGTLLVLAPTIPGTYQSMLTDRADYRAMASWISTYGNPDDPIVATGFGQAELFDYYDGGARQVHVLDQPAALAADLPVELQRHDGLWLLPYWQDPADEAALGVLDRIAAPTAERWFVNTRALYFASPRQLTLESGARGTWDNRVTLEQSAITGAAITPGDAVAAEIHWKVTAPAATPKVSLRLLDDAGATIAQSDAPLSTTPSLPPGTVTTRIGLLVPPVAPPGAYTLAILLYQPDSGATLALSGASSAQNGALVLGPVQVGVRQRPVPLSEAGVALIRPVTFSAGVSLVGHDALGPPRPAGDWLSFGVLWRADRAQLPTVDRTLLLEDTRGGTTTLTTGPILPSDPTSRWSPGQLLEERIRYQIPPTVTSGQYRLLLVVGPGGTASTVLGDVVVSGPERSFARPAVQQRIGARFGSFATLLGDRLAANTVKPGSPLDVTLVWSATATADKSYTAFVHLVDAAGTIRGQIDRVPLNGSRPTDGWLSGEYLTDDYQPRLTATAPPGQYRIDVGLYDGKTGSRVPVVLTNGSKSDHVVVGTFLVAG